MSYLVVTKVETVVSETTNNQYSRVTFAPVLEFLASGRTIFGGNGASRIYNLGKEPAIDDAFGGKIVQFETTPYNITTPEGSRSVSKISVVAFSNENPMELANAQLKRHSASVIVNGKPSVDYAAPSNTPPTPPADPKAEKETVDESAAKNEPAKGSK